MDGARHHYFGSRCERTYARTDVDGQAPNFVAHVFDLPRVQPGADLDAEWSNSRDNRLGAAPRSGWTIEGGEKTVSSRAAPHARVASEHRSHDLVVAFQQLPPRTVAHLGGSLR